MSLPKRSFPELRTWSRPAPSARANGSGARATRPVRIRPRQKSCERPRRREVASVRVRSAGKEHGPNGPTTTGRAPTGSRDRKWSGSEGSEGSVGDASDSDAPEFSSIKKPLSPRGPQMPKGIEFHHSAIAAQIQEDFFGYRGFRESSDQNRNREPRSRSLLVSFGAWLPAAGLPCWVRYFLTRRTRRRTSRGTRAWRSRVSRPTWNRWPRHWTRVLTIASNQSGSRRTSLMGEKSSFRSSGNRPLSHRVWSASRVMPMPTRPTSPPQAIPESPENAQTRPTVARLAIGSDRKV